MSTSYHTNAKAHHEVISLAAYRQIVRRAIASGDPRAVLSMGMSPTAPSFNNRCFWILMMQIVFGGRFPNGHF